MFELHALAISICSILNKTKKVISLNDQLFRFKDNIGEMKYFLKIDEFRQIMGYLTKLIEYESNENILNVRINMLNNYYLLVGL